MARRPWTVFALPGAAVIAMLGAFVLGGAGDGDVAMIASSVFVIALLLFGVWSARTGAWLVAIALAGVSSVAAVLSLLNGFTMANLLLLVGSADALVLLNLPPTREWVGSEAGGKSL